ncbi:MAG: aminopeptidase [Salinarchaeum sp.]
MGLDSAAETAIHQCLNLDATESIAIVTDDERVEIGDALYRAAAAVTDEAVLLQYPPGEQHGAEPPAPIGAAMADSDAFLAPTTKSLSHTRARETACERGARGATLPGITASVFETGLDADYAAIAEACARVYKQVRDADTVRVTAPSGTDITFDVDGRTWREDTGLVHEPGDFSNLPAGEVFVSPVSADGTVVVDGTMMPHGRLDDRVVTIEVADGYATHISDPAVREEVEAAADTVGDAAFNIAELGIGTNTAVEALVGSVLLDEKAAGTIHVAIGDDAAIGGDTEAPIHLDGIVTNPTVSVDGDSLSLPVGALA